MKSKLQQGAENAIRDCLEVTEIDRVVIVTDKETNFIAEELRKSCTEAKAETHIILIEAFIERPATTLPDELISSIENFKPNVSIYCATGKSGELPKFRAPLINYLTKKLNCRHAHMINVNLELMEDGMNKDYNLVYKVTNNVCSLMRSARQLIATDKHGTNIIFDLDPENLKWIPSHGKIKPDIPWQNLPSGETFTTPKSVNGVFYAWVLGDFLSEKYGELKKPLVITIKDGYITKFQHEESNELTEDFEKYVSEYEYGKRVGELGIGTLVGLDHFVGNLLQDEKFPGIHIAFGHPYNDQTGADWDCNSHIDVIAKDVNLTIVTSTGEKKTIMENGKYINEILL